MNTALTASVGGAWLAETYGIEPVAPLATVSQIGGRRATQVIDGVATETYVEVMRPPPTLRWHLTFHLKHEVPHLAVHNSFLVLLFCAAHLCGTERRGYKSLHIVD